MFIEEWGPKGQGGPKPSRASLGSAGQPPPPPPAKQPSAYTWHKLGSATFMWQPLPPGAAAAAAVAAQAAQAAVQGGGGEPAAGAQPPVVVVTVLPPCLPAPLQPPRALPFRWGGA